VFLASLRVENFRGVREATLGFAEVSLWIGENDCGKSSLLEALAIALGGRGGPAEAAPRFEPHHFHRPGGDPKAPVAGPIEIELHFRERQPREWEGEAFAPFASLVSRDRSSPRELVLRIEATPRARSGKTLAAFSLRGVGPRSREKRDDPKLLAALRRACPLLVVRWGAWAAAAGRPARAPARRRLAAELEPLAAAVDAHYRELVEGAGAEAASELRAGYEAAGDLLRRVGARFYRTRGLPRDLVTEMLGAGRRPAPRAPASNAFFHGSAAQQIATLLLTGAALREAPRAFAPGAEPLVVVEDPEAHLHPMTLASVWALVEQIRWQRIVTTQSGALLSEAPLASLRRLTRHDGVVREWRVREGKLRPEELRRFSYHLRVRRGIATFARCWLFVEGETEFWLLPELARLAGWDLALEGVALVEFAQGGVAPLVKVAHELGIEWHLLADGDEAGRAYAEAAAALARPGEAGLRVTRLHEHDIEHCFWRHGYAAVYCELARVGRGASRRMPPWRIIQRAIRARSKPDLAFEILQAAGAPGSPGVPPPLRHTIEACVRLAREAPARLARAGALA
jgi:putative ATP-dependent endonuclease of OLD family